MNTTATISITHDTLQNRNFEDGRAFRAADFGKMDKRTRQAKNLAELIKSHGDLYDITTGYFMGEMYEISEWSTKHVLLTLKDTDAAVALVKEAKSLGLYMENKVRFLIPTQMIVDLDSEHFVVADAFTEVLYVPVQELPEGWELRRVTEGGDMKYLTSLARLVAQKKDENDKQAARLNARAEAEANIPVTRQMIRSKEAANEKIESITNYVLPANPQARHYKEMAVKQATKQLLVMFAEVCGSLEENYGGEFHRVTPIEAFGMVVARTANDSFYFPTELFAEVVQELKWTVSPYINY